MLIALPLLFAGCDKENNDSAASGTASDLLNFETLDKMIGTDATTLSNQLLQMGFTNFSMSAAVPYSYMLQNPTSMEMLLCQLNVEDGVVHGINIVQFALAQSLDASITTFRSYVGQEQQLYIGRERIQNMGQLAWDDTFDSDSEVDGSAEYTSLEEMLAFVASESHLFWEIAWIDVYQGRTAVVGVEYDALQYGDQSIQTLILGVTDGEILR